MKFNVKVQSKIKRSNKLTTKKNTNFVWLLSRKMFLFNYCTGQIFCLYFLSQVFGF